MNCEGKERTILFETYKLHTELAEQVASLREGLNKLYSGMVTAIVGASVLIHRATPDAVSVLVLPILGAIVSIGWMLSLLSVTGRLIAKSRTLRGLEAELPFDFLCQEKKEFKKLRFVFRRKWTGLLMPFTFFILCIISLIFLCLNDNCSAGTTSSCVGAKTI